MPACDGGRDRLKLFRVGARFSAAVAALVALTAVSPKARATACVGLYGMLVDENCKSLGEVSCDVPPRLALTADISCCTPMSDAGCPNQPHRVEAAMLVIHSSNGWRPDDPPIAVFSATGAVCNGVPVFVADRRLQPGSYSLLIAPTDGDVRFSVADNGACPAPHGPAPGGAAGCSVSGSSRHDDRHEATVALVFMGAIASVLRRRARSVRRAPPLLVPPNEAMMPLGHEPRRFERSPPTPSTKRRSVVGRRHIAEPLGGQERA